MKRMKGQVFYLKRAPASSADDEATESWAPGSMTTRSSLVSCVLVDDSIDGRCGRQDVDSLITAQAEMVGVAQDLARGASSDRRGDGVTVAGTGGHHAPVCTAGSGAAQAGVRLNTGFAGPVNVTLGSGAMADSAAGSQTRGRC